uniref:Uncharacterized protein n=1 Tax=Cyanistes caeruleus TaxID=156563 RepID=A0A8C0Z9Q0_CYACU
MAGFGVANERLRALEELEREIGASLQSAGLVILELSKEKPQERHLDRQGWGLGVPRCPQVFPGVSRCVQVCPRCISGVSRCCPGIPRCVPGVSRCPQVYPGVSQVFQVCPGVIQV